eukprot:scaffold17373_cov116-Isochrysis_galbana.AAC.6
MMPRAVRLGVPCPRWNRDARPSKSATKLCSSQGHSWRCRPSHAAPGWLAGGCAAIGRYKPVGRAASPEADRPRRTFDCNRGHRVGSHEAAPLHPPPP